MLTKQFNELEYLLKYEIINFLWSLKFKLGLHTCKASALPLSHKHCPRTLEVCLKGNLKFMVYLFQKVFICLF